MTCPNCSATIQQLPADRSAWCPRCGMHAELMPGGHVRRIRIPVLTQRTMVEAVTDNRRESE